MAYIFTVNFIFLIFFFSFPNLHLTLEVSIKTATDDILNLFSFFQRQFGLAFHMHCLPGRQFTWHTQPYFLWKYKYISLKMSSATILNATLRAKKRAGTQTKLTKKIKKHLEHLRSVRLQLRSVKTFMCQFRSPYLPYTQANSADPDQLGAVWSWSISVIQSAFLTG